MATKDECYDPPVNYCNESDSDDELNNEKSVHSPLSSSPIDDILIHNDLSRKGGMLDIDMDPQAPSRRCQNRQCPRPNREVLASEKMYGSNVFACSNSKAALESDPAYIKRHRFCKNCANWDFCPAPRCGAPKLDKNYNRTPNELPD